MRTSMNTRFIKTSTTSMKTFFSSVLASIVVMVAMAMTSVCAAASGTAVADSIVFTYCDEGASFDAGASSEDRIVAAAMLFTDDLATRYDGCQVVAVDIMNGRFDTQDAAPLTIFFTRGLNDAPYITQEGEMDTNTPYEFKRYELTRPETISAGRGFYVGFTILEESSDFENGLYNAALMKDGIIHNDFPGGFYGYSGNICYENPQDMIWEDEGRSFGQFAIRLVIAGENIPQSLAEITEIIFPYYLKPGEAGSGHITLHNTGATTIDSLEMEYGFDDNLTVTTIETGGIGFNKYCDIPFEATTGMEGINCRLVANILKINDIPVAGMTATTEVRSFDEELGYARNMLVEEGTGQGCGWCVRGIVGMGRMLKAHPDGSFIPVAVFYDYGTQITGHSYDALWEKYLTHLPSCLVNRDLRRYGITDPGDLEYAWQTETSIPSVVDIRDIQLTIDGHRGIVSAAAEFAFDEQDTDYRMAFIITEDNVGPYWQSNAYWDWELDMDGWENLPETVPEAYYNHVARDITDFWGESFMPAEVFANSVHTHSATLDLSLVSNLDNCHVIALVINGKNNHIENAKSVPFAEACGVGSIDYDNTGLPAEYYDLSGMKLPAPPAHGVYISRQGSTVKKVIR